MHFFVIKANVFIIYNSQLKCSALIASDISWREQNEINVFYNIWYTTILKEKRQRPA